MCRGGCGRQSHVACQDRRFCGDHRSVEEISRTHSRGAREMSVVTFGEIMLRLAPPGFERFLQTPRFVATFGGGEANVAVGLAALGDSAAFVTVLPEKHPVSDAIVRELRSFGVDTSRIVFSKGRVGIYYLEAGASQRASKVVYDREQSAIAIAQPGTIDWGATFTGADWLHVTGITP